MSEPIIEPCPFCGVQLTELTNFSTRRTKYFGHPAAQQEGDECIVQGIRIAISDREDDQLRLANWNRRHPSPSQGMVAPAPVENPCGNRGDND